MLFEMIPIDVVSDRVIVLTGEPNSVNGDRTLLSRFVRYCLSRLQLSPLAVASGQEVSVNVQQR